MRAHPIASKPPERVFSDLHGTASADSLAALHHLPSRPLQAVPTSMDERRFLQFCEASDALIWMADMQPGRFRFVYANPGFERIFERPCAKLLSDPWLWPRCIHAQDRGGLARALRAWYAKPASTGFDHTYRLILPCGGTRWVRDRRRRRPVGTNGSQIDGMIEAVEQPARPAQREDDRRRLADRRHPILELSNLLLASLDREEAYTILANSCSAIFPSLSGYLAVGCEGQMVITAQWGQISAPVQRFSLDDCWAIRRDQTHAFGPDLGVAQCRHYERGPDHGHLCVPLTIRGKTLGLLHLSGFESTAQLEQASALAEMVAEVSKLALSNVTLREDLRNQAIRDSLTGLYNRRFLNETLPVELERAQRSGQPLSLALIDVDHFKRYNDNHGHAAGDEALRAVASTLELVMRTSDVSCRYGGEELAVIMPAMSLDNARHRFEQLREKLARLTIHWGSGSLSAPSVSIGIAASPPEPAGAEALLRAADAALYAAKRNGRDRVELADSGDA